MQNNAMNSLFFPILRKACFSCTTKTPLKKFFRALQSQKTCYNKEATLPGGPLAAMPPQSSAALAQLMQRGMALCSNAI